MNDRISRTLEALKNNNMSAIYCEKKEDIPTKVADMLFDNCVITAGGSVSLAQSGVTELIKKDCYVFSDRAKPGISPEEQLEAFKAAIGCDFFFCSANAITENGELINVDGLCNRVSSIAFGPKNVIVVAGINKLVKDINEGFLRVKRVAAPKNSVRLGLNTPCAKIGHCISLEKDCDPAITDGCNSEQRICCSYTITAKQKIKNRITVILCNEPLGY